MSISASRAIGIPYGKIIHSKSRKVFRFYVQRNVKGTQEVALNPSSPINTQERADPAGALSRGKVSGPSPNCQVCESAHGIRVATNWNLERICSQRYRRRLHRAYPSQRWLPGNPPRALTGILRVSLEFSKGDCVIPKTARTRDEHRSHHILRRWLSPFPARPLSVVYSSGCLYSRSRLGGLRMCLTWTTGQFGGR